MQAIGVRFVFVFQRLSLVLIARCIAQCTIQEFCPSLRHAFHAVLFVSLQITVCFCVQELRPQTVSR